MAIVIKYQIFTMDPIPTVNSDGTVVSYANSIDAVTSFTPRDPASDGFDFVKDGGTGYIAQNRVRYILPYSDGVDV